jgi:hypothetical protein
MNKYKEGGTDCTAGREDMVDSATITTTTTTRVRMMILCHHSIHKRSVQGAHNETLGKFR